MAVLLNVLSEWGPVEAIGRSPGPMADTATMGESAGCQRVSQPNASLPVAGVRDMGVPWLLFV